MRPNSPPPNEEERLRREVEELRRQLDEHQRASAHPSTGTRPTATILWVMAVVIVVLGAAAFFTGYLPRQAREATVQAEAHSQETALPRVVVTPVVSASHQSNLVLPGTTQAVTETPILARSTGYVKTRTADIGDRVKAGELLSEIEAPDVDQEVVQAQASLEQAEASAEQANAALEQGKATLALAKITAERWSSLEASGVVSKQDNDTYQSQFKAQTANVNALVKAVSAANSNTDAAKANLARLKDTQGFNQVRAPFAGVVTLRNIDVGTLVSAGTTLLYRIAQTDQLRVYVNVPQSVASSVREGQLAYLTLTDFPGQRFPGRVRRTANSLDPASRTLLVEVDVPNPSGKLMPGMYMDVDLNTPLPNPPVVVPGDALVVRSDGPQVAVVGEDHVIHFKKIQIARDYGDHLDVIAGLKEGDLVVAHPNDTIREGVKVDPLGGKAAAPGE